MKRPLFASSGLWKLGQIGALTLGLSAVSFPQSGCQQSAPPIDTTARQSTSGPVEAARVAAVVDDSPVKHGITTRVASRDSELPSAAASSTEQAPRVELACFLKRVDGVDSCVISAHTSRGVWIESKCSELEIKESDRPMQFAGTSVQNGCHVQLSCESLPSRTRLSFYQKQRNRPFFTINLDCSDRGFFQFPRIIRDRAGIDSESYLPEIQRRVSTATAEHAKLEAIYSRALATAKTGDHARAYQEWRFTEGMANDLGYTTVAARALFQQGETFRRLGRNTEAKQVAAHIRLKYQNMDLATLWSEFLLGDIARDESHYADAMRHLHFSLSISERLGEDEWTRRIIPLIADSAESLGSFAEVKAILERAAQLHLDASISNCEMADFWQQLAFIGFNVTNSPLEKDPGNPVEAVGLSVSTVFDKALEFRSQCTLFDNERLLANLYMGLAALENSRFRPQSAIDWALKAKKLATMSPLTELQLLDQLTQSYISVADRKETARTLNYFEERLSSVDPQHRAIFICSVAMNRLEAERLLGTCLPSYKEIVRSCISPLDDRLSPTEKAHLSKRAARIGVH